MKASAVAGTRVAGATATATATAAPAAPATAPRPAGRPSRGLRLVPPVRRPAPRAPFVVLLGGLLAAGLGGLLYLHTSLAEDSFRLHDLMTRSAVLADREQALEQEVAQEASPTRLAQRAEALGMVRSPNPAFIRLSDGAILGKPKPGVAPPPPPAPTPSATASTNEEAAAEDAPADDDAEPTPTAGAEVDE
jgi:hypothetical protein